MGFTAAELNARPWGDQVTQSDPQDAETLNAGEYGPNPFSIGLTAPDYAINHLNHGEAFRYWDATPLPDASEESNSDGLVFTEVALGGNGHGYFHQTERAVMLEGWGLIPKGSTMFSVLPSVVEFRKDARVLRTAQRWRGVANINRGTGDTDALPERFVSLIQKVTVNGSSVALSHVVAVSAGSPNDTDRGGIKWLSNAPTAGTPYTVEFKYHPLFVCLLESLQGEPIGADGERLPQRVLLQKDRD